MRWAAFAERPAITASAPISWATLISSADGSPVRTTSFS